MCSRCQSRAPGVRPERLGSDPRCGVGGRLKQPALERPVAYSTTNAIDRLGLSRGGLRGGSGRASREHEARAIGTPAAAVRSACRAQGRHTRAPRREARARRRGPRPGAAGRGARSGSARLQRDRAPARAIRGGAPSAASTAAPAQVDAERRRAQFGVVTAAQARRDLHHARPVRRQQHLRVGRAVGQRERPARGLGRSRDIRPPRAARDRDARWRLRTRARAPGRSPSAGRTARRATERVDGELGALDELLPERAAVARIRLGKRGGPVASPPRSTIASPRWP